MSIQGDVGAVVDSATSIVNEKFGLVTNYADEMFNTAKDFLDQMGNLASGSLIPNMPTINIPLDAPVLFVPVPPPQVDAFPNAPAAPTLTMPTAPDKPAINMPVVPVLHVPQIPVAPPYSTPIFNGVVPPHAIHVPAINIETGNNMYDSALLGALRTKLQNNIVIGGTGLSPEVEAAIYARDYERARLALADEMDRFADEWAKRGLPLPDGVLTENMRAMHVTFLDHRLDVSRDIVLKQAELEQTNIFKSIEEAVRLEGLFIDFQKDWNQRIFLRSKAVADASIEVFKATIADYNAQVDAYKAQIEVYKGLLQGELTKAEIYRTGVDAAKMVVSINQAEVDLYRGELEAAKTQLDMYRADIDAFRALLDANKTIVDTYRAMVETYVSKVNAITTKYNAAIAGYRAQFENNVAYNDAVIKSLQTKVMAYGHLSELYVKAWEVMLKNYQTQLGLKTEAAKGGAAVAAQIAAGALAAVGAQVHLSGSGTASEQYQETLSLASS